MAIDNLALYIWFAVPIVVVGLIFYFWKKMWLWGVIGGVIGFAVALISITIFALLIGG